jgi:hypothetical protein
VNIGYDDSIIFDNEEKESTSKSLIKEEDDDYLNGVIK